MPISEISTIFHFIELSRRKGSVKLSGTPISQNHIRSFNQFEVLPNHLVAIHSELEFQHKVKKYMDGFINLRKPFGWTSHDCIAKVRRIIHQKKVGHAGTLDPAATGVLPIAVGRATRLLQYVSQNKEYRATIRFGIRTDTDDLAGTILEEQNASHLNQSIVESALEEFQGIIQQIPPNYSAIQVDGKRLYDLARVGKMIDVPIRTVEIYSIKILNWRMGSHPEVDVAIACGSGTYIRAIARDVGTRVGTGATLAALERTESSGFYLEDSVTIDNLAQFVNQGTFIPIPPEAILKHIPSIYLDSAIAHRWRLGQKVPMDPGWLAHCSEGHFREREEGVFQSRGNNTYLGQARVEQQYDSSQGKIFCVFDAYTQEKDCAVVDGAVPQTNPVFLGIGELLMATNSIESELSVSPYVLKPRMVFSPAS